MATWAKGYLYRSIKALMGITGKPSTDTVYNATFLETQDTVMNLIWTQSIANRLLKTPVDQRESVASRYNLSNQIPTSTEELLDILQRPKKMWKNAKLVLTRSSNQVFKWWTATRYQGHTRNYGNIKCTCDNRTTLTQSHIVVCNRFRGCYDQTALEHDMQVQEIKSVLSERTEDCDLAAIRRINAVEKSLSGRLSNVIGTF
jgi:hypothetical protein